MNNEKLNEILNQIEHMSHLKSEDIPSLDLYMDQIMTLFDVNLADNKRHKDDKLLTKTMINNYSKEGLLKPIKALNLSLGDFEPSKRGEFSLAHAMERIVCACIEPQGYNFCGNLTPHNEYKNLCKKYKKYSALRLLENERFKLDYEFFYKYLEMTPVKNYEIVRIKLKDIKRDWNGKILSLKECHPYKYLLGETKQYEEYCAENRKFGFFMSKQRFSDLLNKINTNHYNTKLMPILTKDNFIADGQHRACILLYKYGENYEIYCLRLEL